MVARPHARVFFSPPWDVDISSSPGGKSAEPPVSKPAEILLCIDERRRARRSQFRQIAAQDTSLSQARRVPKKSNSQVNKSGVDRLTPPSSVKSLRYMYYMYSTHRKFSNSRVPMTNESVVVAALARVYL